MARHKRAVESKLAQARRMLNALPTATVPPSTVPPAPGGASAPAPRLGARLRAGCGGRHGGPLGGRQTVHLGANGPSGFDCSGLMQWSYARAGVGLPRTSQEQRYAGRQVPLSEAKPGT